MGADLYTELAWLPKPPPDFRQRCRALNQPSSEVGLEALKLAAYGLDENQLRQLTQAIVKRREEDQSSSTSPGTAPILAKVFAQN